MKKNGCDIHGKNFQQCISLISEDFGNEKNGVTIEEDTGLFDKTVYIRVGFTKRAIGVMDEMENRFQMPRPVIIRLILKVGTKKLAESGIDGV